MMRISMSQELMKSILLKAPLGFVILDSDYNIVFVNELVEKITGFGIHECCHAQFIKRLVQDKKTLQILYKKLDNCKEKPFDNLDMKIIKKDGAISLVHIEGSAIKAERGYYILLMLKDITNKKSFEKVMESSFDNFIQTTIELDNALQKVKKQQVILDSSIRDSKDQLNIAHHIQKTLKSGEQPANEYVEVRVQSRGNTELGEDYYDFLKFDDTCFGIIFMHIPAAGLLNLLMKIVLKLNTNRIIKTKKDPGQFLSLLNTVVTKIIKPVGVSITAFYIVIDTAGGIIHFANAGHDAALCMQKNKQKVILLGEHNKGPSLGIADAVLYTAERVKIYQGTKIILYSSGIVNMSHKKNEFFGRKRLIKSLTEYCHLKSGQMMKKIMDELSEFCESAALERDGTLVYIEIKKSGIEVVHTRKEKSEIKSAVDDAYTQGRKYIKEKHFGKALKEFFQVIELDADSYGAYSYIGYIYGILEKHSEAEWFFKKAVTLNPEYFQGYYYLGIVLYKQKKYNEAKKYWHQLKTLVGEFKDVESLLKKIP